MEISAEIDIVLLKERLRSEGMEAIIVVYKRYRDEFLGFGKKYSADKTLVLEAWHDAIINFYEILLADKYDATKSSLKTFLFTIGKYKLINKLKQKGKSIPTVGLEEHLMDKEFRTGDIFDESTSQKQVQQMQEALAKLGEKCRNLLLLVYYHEYCVEAIQQQMKYKNEQVVYSHKSRCLKQLRDIFKTS